MFESVWSRIAARALRRVGRAGAVAASVAAMLAVSALSGCASLTAVSADITTPHPAPAALVGANVQLHAAPQTAALPDAALFQRGVVAAMTRAGMHPIVGQPAPYTARYAYNVYLDFEASFPSGWPPPGLPIILPNGTMIYNGAPWWWRGFSWPPPWYERVFQLEIRDTASGALVWQSSVETGSFDERLAPVAQALADAALDGFPQRSGKHTVRLP